MYKHVLTSRIAAMDDFTAEIMASGQDSPERKREQAESGSSVPSQKSGLRSGFAAIREKAGIQDRLVER